MRRDTTKVQTWRALGRGDGVRHALVALCLAVSFLQSCFFSFALEPDPDDTVHMLLGRLALTGDISLFQDELPGHRSPLPFYLIGLSQLIQDRSIVAARLASAAVGVATFILLLSLTTRLAGDVAGVLALLFALSQGVIVGAFAHTSYHSLVSLLLLASLYLHLCASFRYRNLCAMALVSMLFFTRTLMIPLIPAAMIYLLKKTHDRGEQLGIVAVTIVPPLAFFCSDPSHLKLLAFVPVLRRLVTPMGFQASPVMTSADLLGGAADSPWRALTLLARWYKVWILAALILAAVVLVRTIRGLPLGNMLSNRGVNLVATTLLYLSLWQFAAFSGSWSWAVGYLSTVAVLGAVCLGFGYSVLLAYCTTSRTRQMVSVLLAALLLAGPSLSRPPDLPLAVWGDTVPTRALYRLAESLETRIPAGSRVFHLGSFQPLYVAGLDLYLRQVFGAWTISSVADDRVRTKSGLWGEAEIREWLGESEYVVVVPTDLDTYRASCARCVSLVEQLLAQHFTEIAVLTPYPGRAHIVYRRSAASLGSNEAGGAPLLEGSVVTGSPYRFLRRTSSISHDDHDRVRVNFGRNYDRLQALKRRYDPENLFRMNQNIAP